MQILLCAATGFEIAPVIEFIGKEKPSNIDVLITGIGLMAATHSLTKAVLTKRPDFILQAGIAGCIDHSLPLTKVVLIENENIGDLGVFENGSFRSLFDMNLLDHDASPWKNGKLSNNVDALKSSGLTIVDGVTVNEISTSAERIQFYRNELGASAESMEGAALHYVGLMENIRFLQMRSLSNFAGERDKGKWVLQQAIASLNIELQRIILKLLK